MNSDGPLETDGGNILADRRKQLDSKVILRQTVIYKRIGVIFNTKRRLIMYKDGFISYSDKNNMALVK